VILVLLLLSIVGIPWAVVKLVRWSLSSEAVVLDGANWRQAGKVSERSVVGRWWRTWIVLTVVAFIVAAIAPVVGLVHIATGLLALVTAMAHRFSPGAPDWSRPPQS